MVGGDDGDCGGGGDWVVTRMVVCGGCRLWI